MAGVALKALILPEATGEYDRDREAQFLRALEIYFVNLGTQTISDEVDAKRYALLVG